MAFQKDHSCDYMENRVKTDQKPIELVQNILLTKEIQVRENRLIAYLKGIRES